MYTKDNTVIKGNSFKVEIFTQDGRVLGMANLKGTLAEVIVRNKKGLLVEAGEIPFTHIREIVAFILSNYNNQI